MSTKSQQKSVAPRQVRAQVTVHTILEATTRLLERTGESKLTTNHIAEYAGYSIGTLYRYFSDKASIVETLAISELDNSVKTIYEKIDHAVESNSPADVLISICVSSMLESFKGRHMVRGQVFKMMAGKRHLSDVFHSRRRKVLLHLEESLVLTDPSRFGMLTELEREFLLGATFGALNSISMRQPNLIKSPEFKSTMINTITFVLEKQNS